MEKKSPAMIYSAARRRGGRLARPLKWRWFRDNRISGSAVPGEVSSRREGAPEGPFAHLHAPPPKKAAAAARHRPLRARASWASWARAERASTTPRAVRCATCRAGYTTRTPSAPPPCLAAARSVRGAVTTVSVLRAVTTVSSPRERTHPDATRLIHRATPRWPGGRPGAGAGRALANNWARRGRGLMSH